MIRKWDTEDTAPLLALWLDSTIHAHPFISESYWRDSVAVAVDRPKFTVLSDQMLAEIAETRPADERALVRVEVEALAGGRRGDRLRLRSLPRSHGAR